MKKPNFSTATKSQREYVEYLERRYESMKHALDTFKSANKDKGYDVIADPFGDHPTPVTTSKQGVRIGGTRGYTVLRQRSSVGTTKCLRISSASALLTVHMPASNVVEIYGNTDNKVFGD